MAEEAKSKFSLSNVFSGSEVGCKIGVETERVKSVAGTKGTREGRGLATILAGEEYVFRYEEREEYSRWARESFKDAILRKSEGRIASRSEGLDDMKRRWDRAHGGILHVAFLHLRHIRSGFWLENSSSVLCT